jgi:hypothetical protein
MTIPSGANKFIADQIDHLDHLGILAHIIEIDHVCYRVADMDTYDQQKSALSEAGKLLTESIVNGRPIAVYRLQTPLQIGHYTVSLFELPAPKPGRHYNNGYEHIEAVVSSDLSDFKNMFPRITFATDNMHSAVNPDIQISSPSGVIKFHNQSLAEVIAAEQARL